MRFKKIAISVVAGMFLASAVYADQGADQGGSSQPSVDQQQSGQPGGDLGAGGGAQGGAQDQQGGSMQGDSQPGGMQSQDPQSQQGSDLGGTSQPGAGGAMGSTQDPAAVQQIQQKLNDQGYNAGPVDGKFGPKTQEALRKFQQAQGIQATGQVDQQTMAALGVQDSGQGGQPGGAMPGDIPQGGTTPEGTQPGMGSGQEGTQGSDQPGDMGAGQPQPDVSQEGSSPQGSDQGASTPPDAGTSSPDTGAQGSEQPGNDAGASQQ